MSDREKGLIAAAEQVLPNAFHAYCVRHIIKNVTSTFKVKLAPLIWSAAKTHSKKRFDAILEAIQAANPGVSLYLKEIPPERWANSHFPARRVGHLTSNVAESCNAMMKDVRKLFPFNALNAFLNKTSQLLIERLQQHSAATTALPPNVLTKIKDAVKTGSGLAVQRVTESIFKVALIN